MDLYEVHLDSCNSWEWVGFEEEIYWELLCGVHVIKKEKEKLLCEIHPIWKNFKHERSCRTFLAVYFHFFSAPSHMATIIQLDNCRVTVWIWFILEWNSCHWIESALVMRSSHCLWWYAEQFFEMNYVSHVDTNHIFSGVRLFTTKVKFSNTSLNGDLGFTIIDHIFFAFEIKIK